MNLKRIGFLLVACLSWTATDARAQFRYTNTGGTITITGYLSDGARTLKIPSKINGLAVTGIGPSAFENLDVASITIPDSVTTIGDYAFAACQDLTNLTVGSNVTSIGVSAFDHCIILPGVRLPNSLANLGSNAFFYCYNLESVTLGQSLTNIGDGAFSDCSALYDVTIPTSVTRIGASAFAGTAIRTLTVPGSVTRFGSEAFYYCMSLTNVTIGDGVTNIGSSAFLQCYGLKSLTLGAGLTSIGDSAFNDCVELPNVVIPNGVTRIGAGAFGICIALTNVSIPTSVTSIGDEAFSECLALPSVSIPASVTNIGEAPFAQCSQLTTITVDASNSFYTVSGGVLFDKSQSTLIQFPAGLGGDYTIPSSVTTIGVGAFQSCTNLTGATMPPSVTSIGEGAFLDCASLSNITIPRGVTNIGDSAFADCFKAPAITVEAGNPDYVSVGGVLFNESQTTLLQYPNGSYAQDYAVPDTVTNLSDSAFADCSQLYSVTIPASVISMPDFSFANCWRLTSINFEGNAPIVGRYTFIGANNATVYYLFGFSGWGAKFDGLPAVLLDPPAQSGSLMVTLSPLGASDQSTAGWQVDGGQINQSGATVAYLLPGTHELSFTPVFGWVTPPHQTVKISNGVTTKSAGVYVMDVPGNPILEITSPKPGQNINNPQVTVAGIVTDNANLKAVYYEWNGGPWTLATPSNSWHIWTVSLNLTNRMNTLSAYAVDASGDISPVKTVSFNFIPSATLQVQVTGIGLFTPNNYNGALLAVGSNYTLTATPGKNWIFSNWVSSGSQSFISNQPTLSFIMQSNLVLEANFVTNVFLAAEGTYHGLFAPLNSPREQTNSGAVSLTVSSTGAVSGKLTIGTNTPLLSGQFDPAGTASITTPRVGSSTLTTTLQLDFVGHSVSGVVGDGSFTATLAGDQEVFSSAHPDAAYAGQYTLIIPGTNDPTVGPFGASYGTLTVSATGVVRFVGGLADGTAVGPVTSMISKDGKWPFYLSLYGGNGSLWSWNVFTNGSVAAVSNASWINATNPAATAVYRDGFTNLGVAVIGSRYFPTEKPILNLTNADFILEGGDLASVITNDILLASDNVITPEQASDSDALKLKINPATGVITGSFADPSDAAVHFKVNGVLLQNQTNASGYFLGTNQTGNFILTLPHEL